MVQAVDELCRAFVICNVQCTQSSWDIYVICRLGGPYSGNCDRGLENAARGRWPRAAFSSLRSQFFTMQTDPKPVNNLFIFFQALKRKKNTHSKKTHASVTVTVVRDWKIWTALRTNQIVGFVTVPAWKKKNTHYCMP